MPGRPLLLAILAALYLWPSGAAAQEAEPWPMAGHDAGRTGTADGPAPPYAEAWRVEAPAGGPMTSPIVAGGRVVVVGRTGIAAFDATTGETIWEQPRVEGVTGAPAVAGDAVVYAAGGDDGAQLVARSLEDGRRVWSAPLGAPAFSAPAAADGLVAIGTHDGRLLAFEAASGEERWSFEAPGAFDAPPAIGDGLVIGVARRQITQRSTVYAIDAEAGADDGPAWQYTPPLPGFVSGPALGDGFVAVGTGERLVRALGLEEGAERWTGRTRGLFAPRQIPAIPGDVVAADQAYVYRLDAATGEVRWTFQLADLRPLSGGRFNTLVASGPAVVGDTVLIGDGAGTLSAIDLESGRRIAKDVFRGGALSSPSADAAHVYVSILGEEGAVVALEHDPDGRLLSEISPTVLFPGRAVVNFALAAVAVGLVILLVFRVLMRDRRPT